MTREGKGMSLGVYCDLVQTLVARGYTLTDFDTFDRSKPHLLLRHDVDLCLSRAVAMAEAEASIGAQSSYFVLLNTEMYNVHSVAGRAALRRLAALDHKIGLHFDHTDIADGDIEGMNTAVSRECKALEQVMGEPVRAITLHRPAKWMQGLAVDVAGRKQGYHPNFFAPAWYCSDSAGTFRYHLPLEHPAIAEGRGLHLTTHPIWWCASADEGPLDKLRRLRAEHSAAYDEQLVANCAPARDIVPH